MNMKSKRGFTFVELIIVVTIIMILAAIAVPNFTEAQTRALIARSKADLGVVRMTVNTYQTENRQLPQNQKPGVASGWDLAVLTTPVPYLVKLPLDPFTLHTTFRRTPDEMPFSAEPFLYLNALQMGDGNEGLRIIASSLAGNPGFTAALLFGHGPSLRLDDLSTSFTSISSSGEAVLIGYDSSNGTLSGGDIYAFLP